MDIPQNKNYNTLIYLSILVLSLLITFNFTKFINQENLVNLKDKTIQKNKLTGFATEEQKKNNSAKIEQKKEIYSKKSYFIYYLSLFFIVMMVLIISLIFLYHENFLGIAK